MFCKNCGKELPDNAKFCAECGDNMNVGQSPNENVNLFEQDDQDYQYRKSGKIKFNSGKKGGCLKNSLIGLGIIIAVFIVIALLGNNGEISITLRILQIFK